MFTNKNCFIFDFDGVIIDSVEVKNNAFFNLYAHVELSKREKIYSYLKKNQGVSRYQKIFHIEHEYFGNSDQRKINKKIKEFSNNLYREVLNCKLHFDMIDFIDILKEKNKVYCSVVSATPDDELLKIIEVKKLTQRFDFIYGSSRSKIACISDILKQIECSIDSAIYFGDSESDLEVAKILNIDFIGLGPFFNNKKIKDLWAF
jgi:phosphoglycolate phosphatase-like HAD superfamily hydrolase